MDPMLGLLILLILFLIGFPVVYAMAVSALFVMVASTGIKWVTVGSMLITGLNTFTILSIPLFLMAGKVMNACGITDRLFRFARTIIGWVPGGLGHVNILASFIFAGMSGTAIADASGLGMIEIKAMEDAGYDKPFSCAVTSASSSLGPIVPPSMPLIVYGTVAQVSVGALLLAGVLPGVLMALLMMVLVIIYSIIRKYPRDNKPTFKEALSGLKYGILPSLTPVIILLGIYTGIFTATEAAGIVVLYSAFLGVIVYRELNLNGLFNVLKDTVVDAIGICVLLATATLFGQVIVRATIPQQLVKMVMAGIDNKYVFLLLINLILLVVGMFMETVSAITILTPIILPIATAFGIGGVHLGIIMVLNLMIGVISPPFGVVLFAINRVGNIQIIKLVKALIPWYVILVVALICVTLFPWLSETIPVMAGLRV